jgi:hypothetical protein
MAEHGRLGCADTGRLAWCFHSAGETPALRTGKMPMLRSLRDALRLSYRANKKNCSREDLHLEPPPSQSGVHGSYTSGARLVVATPLCRRKTRGNFEQA